MSDLNLSISGTKRLLTKGKYCNKNIVVTADGMGDFWDAYQQNGQREDYQFAFGGIGWDDASFEPKHSIKPRMARNMFSFCGISDLPAALEKTGVTLDFSELYADGSLQLFLNAKVKHIGVLDLSSCALTNYLFYYCTNLETIDKLILSDKMTNFHESNFEGCAALKNITFAGTLGASISLSNSPLLTTESVNSLIDTLKDLTGLAAKTVTFHATVGGNLTEEQKAAITAKNWQLVY